ncbi:hypothetical protein D3C80_1684070 [compost metagenome]
MFGPIFQELGRKLVSVSFDCGGRYFPAVNRWAEVFNEFGKYFIHFGCLALAVHEVPPWQRVQEGIPSCIGPKRLAALGP